MVFIGPQVFKTKPENDSGITGTSQPGPLYVLTHNLMRTGYAKHMLVAVTVTYWSILLYMQYFWHIPVIYVQHSFHI